MSPRTRHCSTAWSGRTTAPEPPARAKVLLQAAVKGAPGEPRFHFYLALVYAAHNEADLAQSELKAAVDSKQPFPERLDALRLLREGSSALPGDGSASAISPRQ
jgi:hypothetical protein